MTNLLYVCEYNIERSPVAEQMTRQIVERGRITDLAVASAGLKKFLKYPRDGITEGMMEALTAKGYYAHSHTPMSVEDLRETLKSQNLVLCFQDYQVEAVLKIEPYLEGRVHTLPRYAGEDSEILPPGARIKGFPSLPLVRRLFYKDLERIHLGIVSDIERCVEMALQRMIKDGLIKPTPK